MKKLVIALIAALLLVSFTAYAEQTAPTATPDPNAVILTEAGAEWIAPAAGEPVTLEKDMGFVVNGVYYQTYSPVEGLLAALGEPVEIISSPSCVFVGEDFEYDYEYGSIFSSPIDEQNIWYEFYIFDVGVTTTRGLAVGDTVEKMLELYGENYYSEGEGMYTYSLSGDPEDYSSPCLIFETEEDIVIAIDVYYPTNVN